MKAERENKLPEGLIEATRYFSDEKRCHDFMVEMRWPNGVTCPRCGSKNIGALVESRRIWNCKGCKQQFSAKVGAVFEDSELSLTKWLPATWLIVNAKNGISSCELHRHEDGDRGRFMDIVRSVTGKRLTYSKLIDLDGKTSGGLPPETTGTWQTA